MSIKVTYNCMCSVICAVFTAVYVSWLVSLACVSSETHNLQAVFLRIQDTKRKSWSQAFLAETVETGNKNRYVTEDTHVLRRKLRKD